MANDAVTHEQLRAGQMAMLDRFDTHEKRFHEVTVRLFDKIEEGAAMGHSNQLALGKIDEKLAGMSDKAVTVGNRLDKIEATVTTLVADGNRREGERGVIAALLRSPFIIALVGAIVGAATAMWAVVKNAAAHVPCIAFALAIAAMAAIPAFAKPVTIIAVHDGDTVTIAGQWAVMGGRKVLFHIPGSVNVRLLGIDTPEMGARAKCQAERDKADQARDNLRRLVQGKADIGPAQHDKYGGRLLADIKVGGVSLSAAQIAGGHAVAYSGDGPKKDWCT